MKFTILFSAIVGLGFAASPMKVASGLQGREQAGVGNGCLLYGICRPLRKRLEERHEPSASKVYDYCKRNARAAGKICSRAACDDVVGKLSLNPAAADSAQTICSTLP